MEAFAKLSKAVKAKIQGSFSPADHERVAMLLLEYGAGKEVERIHLDILEICDSRIEKVSQLVRLANQDFRDLIVAAEYDVIDRKFILKPQFAKRGE